VSFSSQSIEKLHWLYVDFVSSYFVKVLLDINKHLLVEDSLKYKFILCINMDNLTSSFIICIPFLSFSCLITLAMISITMLNKSGEGKHTCLSPDFGGNYFSFSPFSMFSTDL
jgi:hypothetical protein